MNLLYWVSACDAQDLFLPLLCYLSWDCIHISLRPHLSIFYTSALHYLPFFLSWFIANIVSVVPVSVTHKVSNMSRKGLMEQDLSKLDVAQLHPLSPEVISRQATINIGTITNLLSWASWTYLLVLDTSHLVLRLLFSSQFWLLFIISNT